MSTFTSNEHTVDRASVEPDHVWNPNVAYRRLADGDEKALTERLYLAAEQYAKAPAGHLSLQEMQRIIAGDGAGIPQHREHLSVCKYCEGLIATLTPSPEEREEFEFLVSSHKRPIKLSRDQAAAPSAKKLTRWILPFCSGALAASIALGGYLYRELNRGAATLLAITCASGDSTCASAVGLMQSSQSWKNTLAENNEHWIAASQNCTAKTGAKQQCELFAAGAQLQAANGAEKSAPATKVVLAALQGYSFSPAVEERIKDALHTGEASDASQRRRLEQQLRQLELQIKILSVPNLASAASDSKQESTYAELAKLHFEVGDSVRGYESLSQFVALNSPDAGKALMLGLVEPLKDHQMNLPTNDAKLSLK